MQAAGDALIRKAVAGDDAALTALLENRHAALHARVNAKIDPQYRAAFNADDVLQITYLEAFMRIRQFQPDGPGAFDNWLTVIAENNIRDSVRRLNRKKRPPPCRRLGPNADDDSYVNLLASLPGSQTTPSQRASRAEIRLIIEQAVDKLPPDYARVVRAFDLEGRDAAQIAADMQRSTGAVYMLRARAHDWLADILGESTQFFGRSK